MKESKTVLDPDWPKNGDTVLMDDGKVGTACGGGSYIGGDDNGLPRRFVLYIQSGQEAKNGVIMTTFGMLAEEFVQTKGKDINGEITKLSWEIARLEEILDKIT